jgi:hypothetical protein
LGSTVASLVDAYGHEVTERRVVQIRWELWCILSHLVPAKQVCYVSVNSSTLDWGVCLNQFALKIGPTVVSLPLVSLPLSTRPEG